MISAIIITLNEQANIQDCLDSLGWADEIVVVDSGSTDDTVKICMEYGCKVSNSEWSGFGPQKNKALEMASHPWIFSIDADERVSDALREEILQVIRQSEAPSGFLIPRKSSYCGKIMEHSGWAPDFILRLFKRDHGKFSTDLVHERVLIDDKPGKLEHPLFHYPMETFEQVIDKMNLYSSLAAQEKFERGEKGSLSKAIAHGIWTFIRTYFLNLGILDGRQGLMLSFSNASGTYYKYAKLAQMQSERQSQ